MTPLRLLASLAPRRAARAARAASGPIISAVLAFAVLAPPASAQNPAEALRRKTDAANALKSGIALRGRACQHFAKSQALDANQPQIALRLAACKRLDGELGRAEALVARAAALAAAKSPPRRAVDEPRAAAMARIAEPLWNQACGLFTQSLQSDVTLDAALHVATCQLVATVKLREARALLAAVMPTLSAQPPPVIKRMQPVLGALLAELDRLQPYLTVVVLPGSSDTFTIDGVPATSGQPAALDPGPHTVVVRAAEARPAAGKPAAGKPVKSRSFAIALSPSERRTMSLAAEQDKLAAAEFGTGTEHLLQGCGDIERIARTPMAGADALMRLAMCKRLFGLHPDADALWNASDALLTSNLTPPLDAATAQTLRAADLALDKACAHFEASLELDPDVATELAVAGCHLRGGKPRLVRQRLERVLAPPSPLAAPRDQLGRTQAELARALLGDVDRVQPKLRVEPAPGFQGTITVNGMAIEPGATIPMDPGHYIVLQVPRRGPRVVHELVFHDRERIVLKHNLRCNALGKECVDPEKIRRAQQPDQPQ